MSKVVCCPECGADITSAVCVHEWRLATHGPASFEFFQQANAPGYGRVKTSGRKTKWYCVHCRIFEETIDVDESPLE